MHLYSWWYTFCWTVCTVCVCVCVCVCVQASEEQLKGLFEGFGDVKYCQIVRDRRAGRSKG